MNHSRSQSHQSILARLKQLLWPRSSVLEDCSLMYLFCLFFAAFDWVATSTFVTTPIFVSGFGREIGRLVMMGS